MRGTGRRRGALGGGAEDFNGVKATGVSSREGGGERLPVAGVENPVGVFGHHHADDALVPEPDRRTGGPCPFGGGQGGGRGLVGGHVKVGEGVAGGGDLLVVVVQVVPSQGGGGGQDERVEQQGQERAVGAVRWWGAEHGPDRSAQPRGVVVLSLDAGAGGAFEGRCRPPEFLPIGGGSEEGQCVEGFAEGGDVGLPGRGPVVRESAGDVLDGGDRVLPRACGGGCGGQSFADPGPRQVRASFDPEYQIGSASPLVSPSRASV